jgi:hypothetical protein
MAMRRVPRLAAALAACALGLGLATFGAAPTSAHEHRTVAGDYGVVVGFRQEPPYAGESNGLDLCVTRAGSDAPVEGLGRTLHVEVTMGADGLSLPLQPRSGAPGCYDGQFIPTRPGTYYFLITGSLEGRPVNEVFESGPGRFDDVVSAGPIQFPDKVPEGTALREAVSAAEGRAARATTLALAGLAAGLGALGFAAWALASGRRVARTTASTVPAARPPLPREYP